MGQLDEITHRQHLDRVRDWVFLAGAALLTALSVGTFIHKEHGGDPPREWTLSVVETPVELAATTPNATP
ncbi:MAG TPA: hypothetical protein VGM88_27655 [Kofleriaceae bacterium]|jgi:hypothetical protein